MDVTDEGSLSTKQCKLLRVSKQVREDVLDAYSENHLELVHTFRSPTALTFENTIKDSHILQGIRIVLLAWIEENNIPLLEGPERRREFRAKMAMPKAGVQPSGPYDQRCCAAS